MSTAAQNREVVVKPPTEGNIFVFAVTTTTSTHTISTLAGHWITIQAEGVDLYFILGDASMTASATATSGDTRTAYIPAGGQDRFFYNDALSDDGGVLVTSLELISLAGTGNARVWASDYIGNKS